MPQAPRDVGGRPVDRRHIWTAHGYPRSAVSSNPSEEATMSTQADTGEITGTKDKDYNIIWFTEACLDNALCR